MCSTNSVIRRAFSAEKVREAQRNYDEKLHRSPKKDKKHFLDKLEDDLSELGGKERIVRQKAKDAAHNYNKKFDQQIHQRYNDSA